MTLPTTTPLSGTEDDSDMFGPPRSSPVGYHHQRSRVPMISPKLRQREERKRILQLCAHKLERIKDSEANLRRSVCINNTYSRLTDEVRREKQSRYLANLPKSETKPETAHDNIFSAYHNVQNNTTYNDSLELRNDPFHPNMHHHRPLHSNNNNNNNNIINNCNIMTSTSIPLHTATPTIPITNNMNQLSHETIVTGTTTILTATSDKLHSKLSSSLSTIPTSSITGIGTGTGLTTVSTTLSSSSSLSLSSLSSLSSASSTSSSSCSVDTDLEILDRELSAINASMPLIDPEITQGAEQLEKAISSRKRSRTEDENDRLVREALSQFYLPTQRLISAIDDCPLDIKRSKLSNNNLCNLNNNIHINNNINNHHNSNDLDLDLNLNLDINQTQKEFEVIMDALRLGTNSPTPSANDSCGQAAMMSESGVFHNLVVTSLET